MVYNNPLIWEDEAKEEFQQKLDEAALTRELHDRKTVVGLFRNEADAQQAYHKLHQAGFIGEEISVVAHDGTITKEVAEGKKEVVAETAGMGAVGGSMLGGFAGLLAASAGAVIIPGLGPVLAAGTLAATLATTLAGAGIGAAAGGLVGTLVGVGVTQNDAKVYAEGIKKGGLLLVVHTDGAHAEDALEIMHRSNALNIDTHTETG
jgi:uncharacterized membrane protein